MPHSPLLFLSTGTPQKYDPTFKGPIYDRGCTDIVCCVLLVVAIVGYVVVGVVAWTHGDPRKVIHPTDSRGQFCGQQGTPNESSRITRCPGTGSSCEHRWGIPQSQFLPELPSLPPFSCHFPRAKHEQGRHSLLGRHSPPWWSCFGGAGARLEGGETWVPSSLRGLVIAMVASLIFIVLLRFLAGIMVWVMIVMVILVLGYGIFHCYMEYAKLKGEAGSDVSLTDLGFQTDLRVYLHLRQTWLAFLIILCVLELVIVLLLVFLRKRILIAIALIKEASRAVGHVMSSLLFPLCTFFLLCLCIAYWASTAVYPFLVLVLVLSPAPLLPRNPRSPQCLFAFYGGETAYHKYLVVLQFFNVFMFFWLANFVIALGQVTLAGAFASYYWAFKKPDDMPAFPLFSAFGRALRYHTGSLAFGSLVLAVVQVIRVTLEYLDHRLKAAENKFAKFLLSCLKCCFWCLEKFIKFLNRNAYIMIAIYGTNFCTSARNAFFLLMRNIIRVAVLDKVTDFLFFLGKLLIVGSVGILAFFFFTQRIKLVQDTAPPLNYYWVPILTVIVGSYLIAHGFFSVYGMCVDTLFLCFCEDLERNDGSPERPYYMSPELSEILLKGHLEPSKSADSQG
uniref:Choline transporter-like protein n=1 Tax=Cyanoderma ruficeps TaxID=181631 RepID=A0A8C3QXG7_9PASS